MKVFEVELLCGKVILIFGYTLSDAIRRANLEMEEVKNILFEEYVD